MPIGNPASSPIPARSTWLPLRYSVAEQAGIQVFDFWVAEPGRYELSARYPEGKPGPQVVLAVGEGFLGNPWELRRTTLGFAGLCVLIGALVAVVVLVRRERSRKEIYGRFGR